MPIYKKIKFWNLIVLILTLITLIIYTHYTQEIAKEAVASNEIESRPLLILIEEYEKPFKFENIGRGPALNIVLIQGDKDGKMSFIQEKNVLSGLPVRGLGAIQQSDLQILDKEKIIQRIPFAEDFIMELFQKENNYVSLIYGDMFGNHFATTLNGASKDFSKGFEFKILK